MNYSLSGDQWSVWLLTIIHLLGRNSLFIFLNLETAIFIDKKGNITENLNVGRNIAYDTRLKCYTSYVKVSYSKTRTHLTPYTPKI